MFISDEDLISYILGEASPSLVEQIESELVLDPDLQARYQRFREVLLGLDSIAELREPPVDLVSKTMARIEAAFPDQGGGPGASLTAPSLAPVVVPGAPLLRDRSKFLDSAVLTLCLSILCCLALPAIVRARYESRKAQCANNLRLSGRALAQFAEAAPDGRLPRIETRGPEAFAGVFALRLNDNGWLTMPQSLFCPSVIGVRGLPSPFTQPLPTVSQLHQMPEAKLVSWQRNSGGNYAYGLGIVEDSLAQPPKYTGRSHFAILSDAPVIVEDLETFLAHDGQGINLLYEDGRIVFVTVEFLRQVETVADDPFSNLLGDHKIGLDESDASLAPSHFSPLGQSSLGSHQQDAASPRIQLNSSQ